MRFSLRTLLIVMLLAGPLGAYGCSDYNAWLIRREEQRLASQVNWQRAIVIAKQISATQYLSFDREVEFVPFRQSLTEELAMEDPDIVALRRDLREVPTP